MGYYYTLARLFCVVPPKSPVLLYFFFQPCVQKTKITIDIVTNQYNSITDGYHYLFLRVNTSDSDIGSGVSIEPLKRSGSVY